MEHLGRDRALDSPFGGEPHGGHAAAPELSLDDVPVGEGPIQVGEHEGRGRRRRIHAHAIMAAFLVGRR